MSIFMNHPHPLAGKALRFYSYLLLLYPQSYRNEFGVQMLQTFKDHCNDVLETEGKLGVGFWVGVVSDESKNIAQEEIGLLKRQRIPTIFLLMSAILLAGSTIAFSKLIHPVIVGVLLILAMYIIVKKQPATSQASSLVIKNIWVKQGLCYGLVLGIFYAPATIMGLSLAGATQFPPLAKSIAALLLLLGMPGVLALAGFHTGQKSNDASQGMAAGIVAAGVGSIIVTIIIVLTMLSYWKFMSAWRSSEVFGDFLWVNNIDGALLLTLFTLICGGILGTLGGFVGASDPERTEP